MPGIRRRREGAGTVSRPDPDEDFEWVSRWYTDEPVARTIGELEDGTEVRIAAGARNHAEPDDDCEFCQGRLAAESDVNAVEAEDGV